MKRRVKQRPRSDHARGGARRARRSATPRATILATVSQALADDSDVDEILQTVVDALTHMSGDEIVSLHLLNAEGSALVLRAERGMSPDLRQFNWSLPVGRGLIGGAVASGKPLRLANVFKSPDVLPAVKDLVVREGWRGFLSVPIRRPDGRVVGAVSLGRHTSRRFTDANAALLGKVASRVGFMLEKRGER